jgi:hypothetical protein
MAHPTTSKVQNPLSPKATAMLALIQGLLPALVAICGGLWVVFTYLDNQKTAEGQRLENQKELQKQQSFQAERENRTRLIEARKGFADAQLKLYLETANVVGKLVSSDGDWEANFRRYEELYWTELSMVESRGVKEAMQRFAEKVREINPKRLSASPADFEELKQRSYMLALALKASLEESWDVNLGGR